MISEGIWIYSKFPSKCHECAAKVEKGETVLYVKDIKKVYCAKCGEEKIKNMTITVYDAKKVEPKAEPKDEPLQEEIMEPITEKKKRKSRADVSELAETMMGAIVRAAIDSNHDAALVKIKESIEADLIATYGHIPKRIIEIHSDGKKINTVNGTVHEKFEDVAMLVSAAVPVFIVGEAGSGKNHLCKQIADALKLEFYFSNAITNEYKITGFIDANGHYHETQFYKAFVEGGLFFFDEIDASVPEVLVLLNAAIENGYFNFPTGKFNAHPNFRIIAAGNTFGNGATLQYVGRYQLDAASLDRFAVIELSYDKNIEQIIAGGDNEIVEAVHILRDIIRETNLRLVMSYRAINQLNKLVNIQKMHINKAVQYVLIKGMSVDDMNIIKPRLKPTGNKYITALLSQMKNKTG